MTACRRCGNPEATGFDLDYKDGRGSISDRLCEQCRNALESWLDGGAP